MIQFTIDELREIAFSYGVLSDARMLYSDKLPTSVMQVIALLGGAVFIEDQYERVIREAKKLPWSGLEVWIDELGVSLLRFRLVKLAVDKGFIPPIMGGE